MQHHRSRIWWGPALLAVMLLLAASIGSTWSGDVSAEPAAGCLGPVAGQHVYDCAHLLTPAEVTDLEAQAARVEQAGAPTVVYLQVRDATAQQALQDAIDLMNRWNVESRPGAHDGFVMFFDLRPGNLRHGQVALYAGQKHYQHGGHLPQAELDRIRTDVMTPLLTNGQTAAGIAAGLQMVAHDLLYGPPPPPVYRVVAANIGRVPFNVLAALFAAVVAWLFVRLGRRPLIGDASETSGMTLVASPGDLPPAEAGALVKGRISDTQMEATILDFARRGMLVIEPTGKNRVRVQLQSDGKGLAGYEREVWSGLDACADDHRTVSNEDFAQMRKGWNWAKDVLRRQLVEHGWYDPEAAAARRWPLYIAGMVGMAGAVCGIVIASLSQEAWATIGFGIFFATGLAAFIRGYAIPNTTVEGEIAAAPWHGYLNSVADHAYEPNLDTDLPYIVALGLVGKLAPRLKAASERGYAPTWFRTPADQQAASATAMGFYPYWIAFHTSMVPASASGSASGGYAGGGAAGGGGGSAGGF